MNNNIRFHLSRKNSLIFLRPKNNCSLPKPLPISADWEILFKSRVARIASCQVGSLRFLYPNLETLSNVHNNKYLSYVGCCVKFNRDLQSQCVKYAKAGFGSLIRFAIRFLKLVFMAVIHFYPVSSRKSLH